MIVEIENFEPLPDGCKLISQNDTVHGTIGWGMGEEADSYIVRHQVVEVDPSILERGRSSVEDLILDEIERQVEKMRIQEIMQTPEYMTLKAEWDAITKVIAEKFGMGDIEEVDWECDPEDNPHLWELESQRKKLVKLMNQMKK